MFTETNGNLANGCNGAKKSPAADELGGIDDIIGDFGKYQFLVFMFKILIG